MKVLNGLIMGILLLGQGLAYSQDIAYVTADNGLTVREEPKPTARRVGKLNFGEAIEIKETTTIEHLISDEGQAITGKWVKIQSPTLIGYVFNGYLSANKMEPPLELRETGLRLKIKNLSSENEFRIHSLHDLDTLTVELSIGESPEGKIISIDNSIYKRVSMFQLHENSITILNEGPHCDLLGWQHYNSIWRPVEQLSTSKFRFRSYSQSEHQQFMDIDIDELKSYVKENCGEDWYNYIKPIRTIREYPTSVGISRIFLKIILTDENDKIKEKVIAFKIPMGC